jgi:hypothetical protein
LLGKQRTKIDVPRAVRRLSSELSAHVGAYLVATPADARAQMNLQLVGRNLVPRECFESAGHDSSCGTAPSSVEDCYSARLMSDENRNAVRDRNR